MANVSINALSIASVKSILQSRFFYAHSMRKMVEAGLTNCPASNQDKVIKARREEETGLILLASKLGINGLLEGPDAIAWLEKQKTFNATQKAALTGYFNGIKKTEKPESSDDNKVITAQEAMSGVMIEQSSFLEAIRTLINSMVREWVLLVKGTYSLKAKNGNAIKKSAGQLTSHRIAFMQFAAIIKLLGANPNNLFPIAQKQSKMEEWEWDSQEQKEQAIKTWAIDGLPELKSEEKQDERPVWAPF